MSETSPAIIDYRERSIIKIPLQRSFSLPPRNAGTGILLRRSSSLVSPQGDTSLEFTAEAIHDRIVEACSWYRTVVVEGAATCGESDWYAGASITARCIGGEALFHEYSRLHSRYDVEEATKKFRRASTESGPRTCAAIEKDLGYGGCLDCAYRGKNSSPAFHARPWAYDSAPHFGRAIPPAESIQTLLSGMIVSGGY